MLKLKQFVSDLWSAARTAVVGEEVEVEPSVIEPTKPKTRPAVVSWPPAVGRAGEVRTIPVQVDIPFKGKRLIVTELSDDGMSTQILGLFVGNRSQLPTFQSGLLSYFVSAKAFQDWEMDLCDPGLFITAQVLFYVDCTWAGSIVGATPVKEVVSTAPAVAASPVSEPIKEAN